MNNSLDSNMQEKTKPMSYLFSINEQASEQASEKGSNRVSKHAKPGRQKVSVVLTVERKEFQILGL